VERITMNVGDTTYYLAQGQDIATIEAAIVAADREGGEVVEVTLYGNRNLDVVATPGVAITFEIEEVADEDRDDGDLESPFDIPDYYDFDHTPEQPDQGQ
jgi:hypothetical protein